MKPSRRTQAIEFGRAFAINIHEAAGLHPTKARDRWSPEDYLSRLRNYAISRGGFSRKNADLAYQAGIETMRAIARSEGED